MKPKFFLINLFLFLFVYSPNFAQKANNNINYISKSKNISEIKFELKNLSKQLINTTEGKAYGFSFDESTDIKIKGAPELPKLSRSIIISGKSNIKINITNKEFYEIKDVNVVPSKGVISRDKNPDLIPFEYGERYKQNKFFPENLVELGKPYVLRDLNGQVIHIMPLQYNPVTKTLRVYTNVTFEIIDEAASSKNLEITTEFNEIYKSHFLNYAEQRYTALEETGKMLVIAPTKYITAMDTFVNWKNQRGLHTELVELSTIGTSATDIQEYVTEYYNNKGLCYLLLVGDAEDIPSLNKSGDSDAGYGHIVGKDSYAEGFVGRFSAQSIDDVKNQVNKSIYYERDIVSDANWLENGIVIASDEGTSGDGDDNESDIQHMLNLRADLINYGYNKVDKIFDPGARADSVAKALNEGSGVINYVGHGSDVSWATTGFSISHVNNLTNDNKLPFIFDVACVNGNFHGQTCFAESWLRATNNGNHSGAVAIIASTINQSWASPMDAQDEMVDILTESYENNIKRTFGGITVNGIMHMIDEYGADGENMANTWTIFGDPSLNVRTKAPVANSVSHNAETIVGANQFTVNGDNGSVVSLTINNQIIASGTIQNGKVDLEFDAIENPGILLVTVTGYNKITYQSEVDIIVPAIPYVLCNNYTYNDLTGNMDGVANNGEQIDFNLELKNISELYKAFNINTKLRSNDTNIVLIDSIQGFADLEVLATSSIDNAYSFNLKNRVPDKYVVPFTLYITAEDESSNEYEYTSSLNLTVNSPKLEIVGLYIDDSELNNTGVLDPGETTDLKLIIKNAGNGFIENIHGSCSYISGSNYFTINNNETSVFSLNPNQVDTISFSVSVDEQEEIETSLNLEFSLIDNNYDYYSVTEQKEIIIGEILEHMISEEGSVQLKTNMVYFYDSGNEYDQYSSDEEYVITFLPRTSSETIKVKFINFDVENDNYYGGCYDFLNIYNGKSIYNSSLGSFCNENVPTEFIAHNTDGALTFKFSSDSYVEMDGWKAEVSSLDAYKVTFEVTDNEGAIVSARVDFESQSFYTDAEGKAKFEKVIPIDGLSYSVTKSGYQTVTGEFNLESGDKTINVELSLLTGMDEINLSNLKIYPNPSNGIFNIELDNKSNTDYKIKVFDITGTIVFVKDISGMNTAEEQINISDKPKGIYFLSIESENGELINRKILLK